MTGIKMAEKLREDEWGKSAKVIVLTNVSEMSQTEWAMENEIFHYVIKTDTTLESLVAKIKGIIG